MCVGVFHRCSVRPAERHCRLVTRDLSDLVGTLIRYSCSFLPSPLSVFCLSRYDGAKGEGGKPNKDMCASAIVERDPSLVCQNAETHRFQWHSAFRHWRKWPVRGQLVVPTVTRPLGGLRKGGVEALWGLVLTLR